MEDNASDGGEEQGNNNEFKTIETLYDMSESSKQSIDASDNYLATSTSNPVHINGVHSSAQHNFDSGLSTAKELGPDEAKRKVDEILQKTRGVTGNQSALSQNEDSTSAFLSDPGTEVHTLSSSPPLITSQQESGYLAMTSRSADIEHENETADYGVNGTDQVSETEKLSNTEATVVRISLISPHSLH